MKQLANIQQPFTEAVIPPVTPIHHPHGPAPRTRFEVISIIPEEEKLYSVFGEEWSYQLEAISKEPPEMKLLFAIETGVKVHLNRQIEMEPAYRFENSSLTNDVLSAIAERVDIDVQSIKAILDRAPDGVVSIIVARVKNA